MLKRKEFILEVSTSPIENVKAFRLIAESNDWPIKTHEGSRLVDRFAIIIPSTVGVIPKVAAAYCRHY